MTRSSTVSMRLWFRWRCFAPNETFQLRNLKEDDSKSRYRVLRTKVTVFFLASNKFTMPKEEEKNKKKITFFFRLCWNFYTFISKVFVINAVAATHLEMKCCARSSLFRQSVILSSHVIALTLKIPFAISNHAQLEMLWKNGNTMILIR